MNLYGRVRLGNHSLRAEAEARTSRHILSYPSICTVDVHLISFKLLQPASLPLRPLPLTFLAENCLEILRPTVYILRVIRVFKGAGTVQVRELFSQRLGRLCEALVGWICQ